MRQKPDKHTCTLLVFSLKSAHSKLTIIKKVKISCATFHHDAVFQPVVDKLSLAKPPQGLWRNGSNGQAIKRSWNRICALHKKNMA